MNTVETTNSEPFLGMHRLTFVLAERFQGALIKIPELMGACLRPARVHLAIGERASPQS